MAAKSAYILDSEGQPERDNAGKIKSRPDWQKSATDAMGRSYNPKLHGPTPALDAKGFIKVIRRDGPKPMVPGSVLDNTLAIHKSEGYAYYYANAKPGRLERMQAHDWEVVQGQDGPVKLKLTNRELGAEDTVLMRKPQEWYDEDQRAKEEASINRLSEKVGSDGSSRPYGAGEGAREDDFLR